MDNHQAGALIAIATRQAEALEAIGRKLDVLIGIATKQK
jgi:hypothetical protein